MKKYYLNNVTEKAIIISLTAKRTIKPKTSFPLNNKDVVIYKELKRKRAGKPSLLDGLVLSTIKLENDANFINAKAAKNAKPAKSTKEDGKAKKEAEEKAKKELEEQAKKEVEEKAKLEAIAAEKEEIANAFRKEYEEQGKSFAEGDLEKMVEEAYAKAHENDK